MSKTLKVLTEILCVCTSTHTHLCCLQDIFDVKGYATDTNEQRIPKYIYIILNLLVMKVTRLVLLSSNFSSRVFKCSQPCFAR